MTSISPQNESPLVEAPSTSLDELFSRDPLGLSKQDLGTIVKELRRQRETWLEMEKQGKTRGMKAAPKVKTTISLDDLL